MSILLYLLIACAALLAGLFGAALLIQEHARFAVRERLFALSGVSDAHKASAWECFGRAELLAPPWRALRDKLIAPLVLLIPLMLLPREANTLPAWLAYYRNNAGEGDGINGDGQAVLRGGTWINLRDIGWRPEPGERVYTYDDPDYEGDAYYAPGHHPRSWYARWVWLAFRNVASQVDVIAGADVTQRPAVLACGSGAAGGEWSLRWDGGDLYQFTLQEPLIGALNWRANVGYKLGIVANRPDPLTPSEGEQIGGARASVICTWAAFNRGAS